jgi:peptidoglycan/LPS O-acetylase OafA/YrhL
MADRDQRAFIPRIESLRGLAALTVAVLHATSSLIQEPARGVLDQIGYPVIGALTNGYGAVVAFFVISGFVLARSLDRHFFQAGQLALKRILRLLPAAGVAVGIFVLAFYSFGFTLYSGASYTPTNVALNVIMLRADIDRVMWSMKAEAAATPLIFFSAWLARRAGPKYLIALAATLFGLSFIGQYCHAIGDDTNLGPHFAFPVGVWLHFGGRAIVNRLSPAAATTAACASIAAFCACSFFNTVASFGLLVECASAAILVGLIAFHGATRLFAPLDLVPIRFCGKISYSFYLLHPLSLWSGMKVAQYLSATCPALPISIIAVIAAAYSVAATTPLAYLSWRFIELPAMNLRHPQRLVAAASHSWVPGAIARWPGNLHDRRGFRT